MLKVLTETQIINELDKVHDYNMRDDISYENWVKSFYVKIGLKMALGLYNTNDVIELIEKFEK